MSQWKFFLELNHKILYFQIKMTRYAKYKGNTHRQENEASSWKEQLSAAKEISKSKIERTEKRRLKRQEDKKGTFLFILL